MESAIISKILEMGSVVALLIYGYMQLKKEHSVNQTDYKDFVKNVMEQNKAREEAYKKRIDELNDKVNIVNEINTNLRELRIKIETLINLVQKGE